MKIVSCLGWLEAQFVLPVASESIPSFPLLIPADFRANTVLEAFFEFSALVVVVIFLNVSAISVVSLFSLCCHSVHVSSFLGLFLVCRLVFDSCCITSARGHVSLLFFLRVEFLCSSSSFYSFRYHLFWLIRPLRFASSCAFLQG